jgi:asparagine synthase (glutamine-hydrolysing)
MGLSGHFRPSREAPWAAADGIDPAQVQRLYEAHGIGMLQRLRGGFALALWDGDTLLLARDAFGQKPLYYAAKAGELWFGGDVRALREEGAPLGQIDRGALSDYLELLYVPAPATVWSGMRKLPAGHLLRAGEQGVEVRRWFELPAPGSSTVRPSRIAVRARLEEAVGANSGTGASLLLTGDLPSLALLALTTRKRGRVRSFTPGADPLAHRMAERFRSEHRTAKVAALDELHKILEPAPEPLGDARALLLAASLRAMAGAPVVTAAGGDELFAGHPHYLRAQRLPHSHRAARAADLLKSIAPQRHRGRLERAASALGTRGAGRARALVEVFSADERRALLGGQARSAQGATGPDALDADAALAFDLEVALPDGTLAALQAAAASAGADVRAPLLDVKLAQTVVPAEARHKLGRTHGNRLLREAVADLLPRDALTPEPRPPLPLHTWLRGPLRALLHDLVASPAARIRTLFDPRAIDSTLRHSLLPRGDPRQAWALLALEIWVRAQRR